MALIPNNIKHIPVLKLFISNVDKKYTYDCLIKQNKTKNSVDDKQQLFTRFSRKG